VLGRLIALALLGLSACGPSARAPEAAEGSSSSSTTSGTSSSGSTTDESTSSSTGPVGLQCPEPEPGLQHYIAYIDHGPAEFSTRHPVAGTCDALEFHPGRTGWYDGPRLTLQCAFDPKGEPPSGQIELRFVTTQLDEVLQSFVGLEGLEVRFASTWSWLGSPMSTEFSVRDSSGQLLALQLIRGLSNDDTIVELRSPSWIPDDDPTSAGWTAPFTRIAAEHIGCASRPPSAGRFHASEFPWLVTLESADSTTQLYDRSVTTTNAAGASYLIAVESAVTADDPTTGGGSTDPTNLAQVLILRTTSP
jgi:hypothetical protein